MFQKPLATVAIVVLFLAGCGEEDPGSPGAAAGLMTGPEAVSFGESLAQIRGHHLAAVELYRAGDGAAAMVHVHHPIDEILASLSSDLRTHGADPAELTRVLNEARSVVESEGPVRDLEAAARRAASATEGALAAVVGDDASDPSYRGSVIAALLRTVVGEYEEAVGGGAIELVAEYQDGYAFLQEAERLYEAVAPEVEAASEVEAGEIEGAFADLDRALASVQPPRSPAGVEEIEAAAELIGHELAETVGATLDRERSPEEVAAAIEDLLAQVRDTYASGNVEVAMELAAEAYLENYEVIEPGVIEAAPEVNAELEPLLGAELRKRMGEGAPASEIRSMITRARGLLDQALAALGEG